MTSHLLIVDDEPDAAELLGAILRRDGHRVTTALDLQGAYEGLEQGCDVVLTDLDLGGESGLDLCKRVADRSPNLPVILVTAHATLDVAVQALRAGAYDFLTKPVDTDQLRVRLERALAHRDLVDEVDRLRRLAADAPGIGEIIGESPPMKRLFSLIARLGDSDASVMITGESGVGKELVARALHAQGLRAREPFVAVNCAAVPENLIESELFGHVRGAFTDASRNRDGLFQRANRGTLFLDEVGELSPEMQPKLLRALQEQRVRPIGGDREIAVDARIICATNRDLEAEVEAGRFREDLFYRLNVVHVHVPPLRLRGPDIVLLAQRFLRAASERIGRGVPDLSAEAADKLLAYDWPGNVRELENAMERGVALCRGDAIEVEDLPAKVRDHQREELEFGGGDLSELPTLDELESRYVRRVLKLVDGNKSQAAEILGVGRRTLYRKLARMEEDAEDA